MKFSEGQIIFGIIFALVFSGIITFTYLKDKKLHEFYYKKSYLTFIGFVVFILFLFFIKSYLKK
jgi:hypothetical protein